MVPSSLGRVDGVGGCPSVRKRIVSAAAVQVAATTASASAPDDHFTAGPHGRVRLSGKWRVDRVGRRPTIRGGIVSSAAVQVAGWVVVPTPNYHLTAGPHRRVKVSTGGCVGAARSHPTVGRRIVSPAGVEGVQLVVGDVVTAPDNHLTSGPQCGVECPYVGRIHRSGGSPGVVRAVERNRDFWKLVALRRKSGCCGERLGVRRGERLYIALPP